MEQFHATTIVAVRRGTQVAIGGDGQVTLGNTVVKGTAQKIRRLYKNTELAGFAGDAADAFTLQQRIDAKLEEHQGQLLRSHLELTPDWHTDHVYRPHEAMLIGVDHDLSLNLTRNGDYIEPVHVVAPIRSDVTFAQAAALPFAKNTEPITSEIDSQALSIAGDICIYSN